MKTVNISDDLHAELKKLSEDFNVSLNSLVSTAISKGAESIPGSVVQADINVSYKTITDVMKEASKPLPDFLVQRYVNRKIKSPKLTARECAETLLMMLVDGYVVRDENELYALPGDSDPI